MNSLLSKYTKKIIINLRLFNLKLFSRCDNFQVSGVPNLHYFADIEVSKLAHIYIGDAFTMNKNALIAVRDNASLIIGDRVYLNRNTIITSRKYIEIGNNVTIGPNVCIYDYDHAAGGIALIM